MTPIGDPMTTNPTLRHRIVRALNESGRVAGLDLDLLASVVLSAVEPELARLRTVVREDGVELARLRAEVDKARWDFDGRKASEEAAVRDLNELLWLHAEAVWLASWLRDVAYGNARFHEQATEESDQLYAKNDALRSRVELAERERDEARAEVARLSSGDTPTPDEDPDVIVDATRILRGTYCVFDESKERWWRPARAEVDRIVGALSSAGLLRAPAPQPQGCHGIAHAGPCGPGNCVTPAPARKPSDSLGSGPGWRMPCERRGPWCHTGRCACRPAPPEVSR